MAASLQYKRGAPVGAGCVEGLCFKGQGKGSKRKVDARYAGEGYGLLTQAGCVPTGETTHWILRSLRLPYSTAITDSQ